MLELMLTASAEAWSIATIMAVAIEVFIMNLILLKLKHLYQSIGNEFIVILTERQFEVQFKQSKGGKS